MDIRSHWSLLPEVSFLNHGSFGACPTAVLEYQAELRRRQEREPMRFFNQDLAALLVTARRSLAEFLSCQASSLALVTNATTGVNTVLRSLSFEPGGEILTTSHVYAACRYAMEFVAERQGGSIRVVDVPFPITSPDDIAERIVSQVNERTQIALIDHVTSATGLVLPLATILEELRARGVDTLVDGAHAPGMVDVDLATLAPTYYTANCHKWLSAPKGAAFLYVQPDKLQEVRPLVISHGARVQRPGESRFEAEFGWQGTDDPSAYLCVPKVIEFLGSLLPGGWPELRETNRNLALQARQLLSAQLEFPLPCPETMVGSLATIPIPDGFFPPHIQSLGADPIRHLILNEHAIEVMICEFPPGSGQLCLRISAMIYNELQEYASLAAALKQIAKR